MKYQDLHIGWKNTFNEIVCVFGFATGRVEYKPKAKYLYSFRVFVGPLRFEILWTTGADLTGKQEE